MQKKEFIFGTWQIGGLPSFRDVSEGEAIGLLEYAYSLGIRSFDTAPIYGLGKSEMLLGKALKDVRKNIRIITKFGYSLTGNRSLYDVSPNAINSQLHESLERLQTEYIDTYILHILERIDSLESIIECLNTMKKKGYIRQYGLSNTTGLLLEAFLRAKNSDITVIQDFYNAIDRSAEKTIFPYLADREFMVYSPFYRGGLTETSIAEILKKNEVGTDMLFKNEGLPSFIKDRKIFEIIAERQGLTLRELALSFLIRNPHVSSIIFGTSKKDHLLSNYSLFKKFKE